MTANNKSIFFRGRLILCDRVERGVLEVRDGRIAAKHAFDWPLSPDSVVIDSLDGWISPGFVDLHVHGGDGGDFMDGTPEAFRAALSAHLRHGTTRLAVTTTVARHEQIIRALELTRQFRRLPHPTGSRVLGAHFYGPYFRYEARGAHPGAGIRPAVQKEFMEYLSFSDDLVAATVAPEIEGAKEFALACRDRGVRTNAGHSWATFEQMREAIGWGIQHVDHLYCAMSDKGKLRSLQMYPMQGGVFEATLYFDELTTEVIADGRHLDAGLLLLAIKIKGSQRVALITDSSRALDMPHGEYLLGPTDGGETFVTRDGVGMLPDFKALASSIKGMDHMVRTFHDMTRRPIWEVIRMASLTPATIAGRDRDLGSLDIGKIADILLLSPTLEINRVFVEGMEIVPSAPLSSIVS